MYELGKVGGGTNAATRILLRRTSIPSWLNDAPPNVPTYTRLSIISPRQIYPLLSIFPREMETSPTILIKTSLYIYIYLINICIVGSMTPSMSKVTIPPPSFPRPVVLGSGILLSAEEGTMVGARYPIEKKRPAAGPGTIFHYILRASITLNNDVHKIRPCALVQPARNLALAAGGFGSHCCKRRSSKAAVPLSGWMLI